MKRPPTKTLTYRIKRKGGRKGPLLMFRDGKPAGLPTTPELEFWSEIRRLNTELTKVERTVRAVRSSFGMSP